MSKVARSRHAHVVVAAVLAWVVLGIGPMDAAALGAWSPAPSLGTPRVDFGAIALDDGRILVTGGAPFASAATSAELFDSGADTWSATGAMLSGRIGPVLSLLPDGRVLATGGVNGAGLMVPTTEVFDPSAGAWSPGPSMLTPRRNHTATTLADGRVLVVGGTTQSAVTGTAELYDPSTGSWTPTGSLHLPRYRHAATLLADGRVLVTGGFTPGAYHTPTKSVELYDPATGSWTVESPMGDFRATHVAIRLASGEVLVAGGVTQPPLVSGFAISASTEVWSEVTGRWTPLGAMGAARRLADGVLLGDGTVLVAGGVDGTTGLLAAAERFDPASGAWSDAGALATARAPRLIALPDGRILAIGSLSRVITATVEAYAP